MLNDAQSRELLLDAEYRAEWKRILTGMFEACVDLPTRPSPPPKRKPTRNGNQALLDCNCERCFRKWENSR